MEEQKEKYMEELKEKTYEELIDELKKSNELKDNGEKIESKAIINALNEMLKKMTHNSEKEVEQIETTNEVVLPVHGEKFTNNDKISLRVIQENEKNDYLAVSREYSYTKGAFEDEEFVNLWWNDFMSNKSFVCSIYDKNTGNYIGYCSIDDLTKKDWELVMELKPEWCHKGYGTEAALLFLKKLTALTGNRFYRIRTDIDNYASQALMKKIGAYPNGISEFWLTGEELEKFKKEYANTIDDKIRAVAKEFCMSPEDIIGYVLEYRIDMNNL